MTYAEWETKWGVKPYCSSGVMDGWVPILERLMGDLDAMGWDRSLAQVKEKFGGLRFYADNATDAMLLRIEQAEVEAWRVCEVCGAEGKTRRDTSYIQTLCDTHAGAR